jgi:hypothetical protein
MMLDVEKSPIHARDRFLLEAMGPLVRFDNAYLHAIRAARDGRLSSTPAEMLVNKEALTGRESKRQDMEDLGMKIAEQMAIAEKELAQLGSGRDKRHLGLYVAVARFTMLRTAIRLVLWLKVGGTWTWDGGPHWIDWNSEQARKRLPTLHARRMQFLEEGRRPEASVAGFLQGARIEPRELPALLPPFWASSSTSER